MLRTEGTELYYLKETVPKNWVSLIAGLEYGMEWNSGMENTMEWLVYAFTLLALFNIVWTIYYVSRAIISL